jgi:hypothetical protein
MRRELKSFGYSVNHQPSMTLPVRPVGSRPCFIFLTDAGALRVSGVASVREGGRRHRWHGEYGGGGGLRAFGLGGKKKIINIDVNSRRRRWPDRRCVKGWWQLARQRSREAAGARGRGHPEQGFEQPLSNG